MAEKNRLAWTCFEKESSYLFTWSIEKFSTINGKLLGPRFQPSTRYTGFYIHIDCLPEYLEIKLISENSYSWKNHISLFDVRGKLLHSNSFTIASNQCILSLSGKEEVFQKLKSLPMDTLLISWRFKIGESYSLSTWRSGSDYFDVAGYRKNLAADLKPVLSTEEKVDLLVGEETLTLNKAVLCARCPVFARMFQSEMREKVNNSITIEDVKMSVMRSFASFLYTGIVLNLDLEHFYELYYAADKYEFSELRDVCGNWLSTNVTEGNVFRLLAFSVQHHDERLKFIAMTFIFANRTSIMKSDEWKTLMDVQPKLALEAVNFLEP